MMDTTAMKPTNQPPVMRSRPRAQIRRHSRGFTLMEVLIAILVLSLGLLGLAALQSIGFKFNQDSFERTQATLLAYDIIDRIRANPVARDAASNNYNNIAISTTTADYTLPSDKYCLSGCTAAEMRNYDLNRWKDRLTRSLAAGQGAVCRGAFDTTTLACTVDTTATRFQVAIRWFEGDQVAANNTPQTVIIDVEI